MAGLFAMHLVDKSRKMSGQAQEVTDVQETSAVLYLKISSTDNIRSHPTMYLYMSRIFSIKFTESEFLQKHETHNLYDCIIYLIRFDVYRDNKLYILNFCDLLLCVLFRSVKWRKSHTPCWTWRYCGVYNNNTQKYTLCSTVTHNRHPSPFKIPHLQSYEDLSLYPVPVRHINDTCSLLH
jgi:hypothetical protein